MQDVVLAHGQTVSITSSTMVGWDAVPEYSYENPSRNVSRKILHL